MTEIDMSEVINEVTSLRDQNNKKAGLSLLGLLSVFFLSLSFFLFSDYLSPSNSQTTDKDIYLYENELKKQLADLNVKFGEVLSDLALYGKDGLTESEQIRKQKIDPEPALKERADYLSSQKSSIAKELGVIQEGRLVALKASNETKSIESIIATSITRIGAVLLSVFMMQILLGFFRYYTRLANHYATKLIAFKAIGANSQEHLSNVVESMQAENITFGKEPQMPFEKVFELLKANK